jgi:hypothetical protein
MRPLLSIGEPAPASPVCMCGGLAARAPQVGGNICVARKSKPLLLSPDGLSGLHAEWRSRLAVVKILQKGLRRLPWRLRVLLHAAPAAQTNTLCHGRSIASGFIHHECPRPHGIPPEAVGPERDSPCHSNTPYRCHAAAPAPPFTGMIPSTSQRITRRSHRCVIAKKPSRRDNGS